MEATTNKWFKWDPERIFTNPDAIGDDSILGKIALSEQRPIILNVGGHSPAVSYGDKAIGELLRQGMFFEQALRLFYKRGIVLMHGGVWLVETTDALHRQGFDEFEPAFMYALDLMIQIQGDSADGG